MNLMDRLKAAQTGMPLVTLDYFMRVVLSAMVGVFQFVPVI